MSEHSLLLGRHPAVELLNHRACLLFTVAGANKQLLQFSLLPAMEEPHIPTSTGVARLFTFTHSGRACYSAFLLQLYGYRDHGIGRHCTLH